MTCACAKPRCAGWNVRLCAKCDGYLEPVARTAPPALNPYAAPRAAVSTRALEWRNDHGSSCTCIDCAMQRFAP